MGSSLVEVGGETTEIFRSPDSSSSRDCAAYTSLRERSNRYAFKEEECHDVIGNASHLDRLHGRIISVYRRCNNLSSSTSTTALRKVSHSKHESLQSRQYSSQYRDICDLYCRNEYVVPTHSESSRPTAKQSKPINSELEQISKTEINDPFELPNTHTRQVMILLQRVTIRSEYEHRPKLSQCTNSASGVSVSSSSRKRPSNKHTNDRDSRSSNTNEPEGYRSDDDNDREHRHKRALNATSSSSSRRDRRLACPFYKRNPGKHQHAICLGPGWESTFRVKEHIYRRHGPRHRCPRCCQQFDNDSNLQEHLRLDEQCLRTQNSDLPDYITLDIEARLRSRGPYKSGQTEIEKWKAMYQIIFPLDDPSAIPSPFYERESDSNDLRNFITQQIPSIVHKGLERVPIPTSEDSMVTFMRQCLDSAFRIYDEDHTRHPQSSSSPSLDDSARVQLETQSAPTTQDTLLSTDLFTIDLPLFHTHADFSFSTDNFLMLEGNLGGFEAFPPPLEDSTLVDTSVDSRQKVDTNRVLSD